MSWTISLSFHRFVRCIGDLDEGTSNKLFHMTSFWKVRVQRASTYLGGVELQSTFNCSTSPNILKGSATLLYLIAWAQKTAQQTRTYCVNV